MPRPALVDLLDAARLLWTLASSKAPPVASTRLPLRLRGGGVLARHHFAPQGRPRGRLLLVHGLTLRGADDPRLIALASAMAGIGLEVDLPHFPILAEPRMAVESVDELAAAIEAVSIEAGGPIGAFGVSFAGGLALVAAARPEVGARLSGLLVLGSYSELGRAIRFLVCDPEADPYGFHVALANFVEAGIGPHPAVRAALQELVADDGLHREEPRFPAARAALSEEDRAALDGVLTDPVVRRAAAERILVELADEVRRLDAREAVRQVSAPVVLVHGSTDRVVHPDDSADLHAARLAAGLPSRLEITPLVGHSDTAFSLRTVPQALRLVHAFACWLAAMTS